MNAAGRPRPGVRVATWNVHGCVGRDGRHAPERIVRVVDEIDADVVALQEVHMGEQGPHLGTLPAHYVSVLGPTVVSDDQRYGNAILTRLPVRDVRLLDLSEPLREPRGALSLTLEAAPGAALHVVATHLGLRRRERRRQLARLLEHLPPPGGLLVVLGDFNDWLPLGGDVRALDLLLGPVPRLPTFPSGRPLWALDRIWVRPAHHLRRLAVHSTPVSRTASDHLPLVATLDPFAGPSPRAAPGSGTPLA